MKTIDFGGYTYYFVYRIYITEPCLIRKANGIYPGCTEDVSIAAEPIERAETYYDVEEAKAALEHFHSIIRDGDGYAPRGFAYVIEYYAQKLIIDETGKPYNKEKERIYAEMEYTDIRQKKPPKPKQPDGKAKK